MHVAVELSRPVNGWWDVHTRLCNYDIKAICQNGKKLTCRISLK